MARDPSLGKRILALSAQELKQQRFKLNGSVAIRVEGCLHHGIAVRRSQFGDQKFYILLDIAILDPFLDPPDYVVCLRGYVGPAGAGFRQHWWSQNEATKAAAVVSSHAEKWLTSVGNSTSLITAFEQGISAKESIEDRREGEQPSSEIADSIIAAFGLKKVQLALPFVYHRWLSLLYFHQGRTSEACVHAKEFLKHAMRMTGTEPERTNRMLAELNRL